MPRCIKLSPRCNNNVAGNRVMFTASCAAPIPGSQPPSPSPQPVPPTISNRTRTPSWGGGTWAGGSVLITRIYSREDSFCSNAYAMDTTTLRPQIMGDTNARHWPDAENEFKFHFELAGETEKNTYFRAPSRTNSWYSDRWTQHYRCSSLGGYSLTPL